MKKIVLISLLFFEIIWAQEQLKHEVFFETDVFEVSKLEHSRLLLFLSKIDSLDIEKITIYGFTDDRGSVPYNLLLSQNRANSIKTIFLNNEFDDSIITIVDGKGKILLDSVNEEAISKIRDSNRKVEIIVSLVFPGKSEQKSITKTLIKTFEGELKVGDNIVLNNILFRTGYSYLLPQSTQPLEELLKILLKRTDVYFTIQGHVCCTENTRDAIDRKTRKRNLSVARAQYIFDYLVKNGIQTRRMKHVGMRRKFPLGGDAKYDRRVEILITHVGEDN